MQQPLIKPIELIKDSWRTFIKTWDKTITYSSWYIAIAAISSIGAYLATGSLGLRFISSVFEITATIASMLLSIRLYQTALAIESQNTPPNFFTKQTWKIVLQTLGASALVILAVLSYFAVMVIAITLFSKLPIHLIFRLILVTALVIPSSLALIYASIRITFSQVRIIDQTRGIMEAFKYSWSISKDRFWAIFGRFLLAGIIFGGLTAVVMFIAISIVSAISGINIGVEMAKENVSPLITSIENIIQGIVMVGIMPLFYIFGAKLFRNVEKSS